MRLTVRLLGLDLLDLEVTTRYQSDTTEEDDDAWVHLSGGTTATDRIDAGPTDHYMGFTGGLGDDD